MAEKMTKKEMFAAIQEIMVTEGHEDLAEFCATEIAMLDKRAENAKNRKAAKAAEPDDLKDAVLAALTSEPESAETITDKIEAALAAEGSELEVTVGKVRFRLSALTREEVAVKSDIKVETDGKTRTVKGYALA